jgi:imidazolonepropionase
MERITIRNARVLTLQGQGVRRGAAMVDLGLIERGFVTCERGRVSSVGSGEPEGSWDRVIDAGGRVCMPALVDAHAHLCWGGDRWAEWEQIRAGVPYPKILAEGGGILSTVRATRAASRAELAEGVARRLHAMAALGIGATDAKSGYGLEPESEARMLQAIGDAAADSPMLVRRTFLGGHAVPPDDAGWPERLAREVVPAFARAFPDVAVDAFCERSALDVDACRAILRAARAAGLAGRLHTDQFTSMGGAEMAIAEGARTVDHLEAATPETVQAVGRSGTIAVILPCSGYALDGRYAPARALVDAGAAVAIGSNANPGSAPTVDLRMAMHLAVRHAGLGCAEAIVAATVNAAHAIGAADEVGMLSPGMRANLIVLEDRDERGLVHAFGGPPPRVVLLGGRMLQG